MDQRTRMFTTLVCLAVSMTGSALLLAWSDPLDPEVATFLAAEDAMARARSAVVADAPILPGHWGAIHVTAGSPHIGQAMLTATADQTTCHFLIDASGSVLRAEPWRAQRDLADAPAIVRIQVACEIEGGVMAAGQWLGVRTLVSVLNDRLAEPDNPLPVIFDPAWGTPEGLPVQALLNASPETARAG